MNPHQKVSQTVHVSHQPGTRGSTVNVHVHGSHAVNQSFVVNLKPGSYKLSVNLKPHKKHTRRHSPHSQKQLFPGPKVPEQLLYPDEINKDGDRIADDKKNQGNELFKLKKYNEAEALYTQAIDLCPDCASYFSNRSACYMMLGKYADALADARESVRLDPGFVKGHLRVGKCLIALGDSHAAIVTLKKTLEMEQSKNVRDELTRAETLHKLLDDVQKYLDKNDHRTALFHVERALTFAVGSSKLNLLKAECCVYANRFNDCNEITMKFSNNDNEILDAYYVRGLCLYHQDQNDKALSYFSHVAKRAPGHRATDAYKRCKLMKEKRNEGKEAFGSNDFEKADRIYTESLTIDPTAKKINSKLFYNRSLARFRMNKFEEAMQDCSEALSRDGQYLKALFKRSECYLKLEKFEEAVRDLQKLNDLEKHNTYYSAKLRDANLLLKKSKRKDYYKILGISQSASTEDVKKAYKDKARRHHPDRHSTASPEEKRKHEEIFKDIYESYEVLSNPMKKKNYDLGVEPNNGDYSTASDLFTHCFDPPFRGGQQYHFANTPFF